MRDLSQGYDYIVVGGGTAGCVLASRLSERTDVRVLLVEAGPPDRSLLIAVPGAAFAVYADPRNGWGYETEPQPGMDGRRFSLIQAKVLGGGSSINGMVYTRGAANVFNAWRDMGADGWGYDDVLPYFRRVEDSDRGAGPFHGSGGPLRVERGRSDLPITERILAAFGESGIPVIDDLSVAMPDGVGYYDWSVAHGRRASIPAVFPGLRNDRANLTVVTNAYVTRLVAEGHRIVGVELRRDGVTSTIRADREVAVCAGAIGSPKLLLLSGIGPADDLRRLGIPVLCEQNYVGKNLQNHITHRLEFLCTEPITGRRYTRPLRGAFEVLRYAFARTGALAGATSPAGGFVRSGADAADPDVQVFSMIALLNPKPGLGMLPTIHGYGLAFNQGTPYSRGTVSLRANDATAAPVIDPRYLDDPRDIEIMISAAERMRAVAAAPSLAKVTSRERFPGPQVRTRDDWARDIRANAGNHFHVCGTCRMGRSGADSVTDSRLRVHDLKGLRVVDASVMPLLMNANTNAAVVMIAARAAEWMAAN